MTPTGSLGRLSVIQVMVVQGGLNQEQLDIALDSTLLGPDRWNKTALCTLLSSHLFFSLLQVSVRLQHSNGYHGD